MKKGYYDEYEHFELHHWWFVQRRRLLHQVIDQQLPDPAGARWLDIGCGTGVLLDSYTRIPPASKIGLELDAGSVERARAKGLDVRQTAGDWDFAELGSFDLISMCDVIEHLEDESPALAEAWRRLRPGGTLLVTVPALMSLWSPHDEVNHHFRRYRRPQLMRLFEEPRWQILRCTYFCSLLLPMIYTARKLSSVHRRYGGKPSHHFKMGPRWMDATLGGIFGLERHWLRIGRFPLGSSLLLLARKPATAEAPAAAPAPAL